VEEQLVPVDEQLVSSAPAPFPPVRPVTSSEITQYVPAQFLAPHQLPQARPRVVAPVTVQPEPAHPTSLYAQPRRKPRHLNGAALAALIVAVAFPPAGLGLAKTARRECREDNRPGAGLALVAHVIAATGTCAILLVSLTLLGLFAYGMIELGSGLHEIGAFLSLIGKLFS
jgi:hypothetical protein